jgi:putative transposase
VATSPTAEIGAQIPSRFRLPAPLWARVEPHLSAPPPRPLGGDATGPNPTDRAKRGTKLASSPTAPAFPWASPWGPPIATTTSSFGRPSTAERSFPPVRPRNTSASTRATTTLEVTEIGEALEFVAHTRYRGEEAQEMARNRMRRPRRWVVERLHSWMNRFRRLVVRWERKLVNYLAEVQFACAWIIYRAAGLFPAR